MIVRDEETTFGIHGRLTRRNLAKVAEERGDHAKTRRLWQAILKECPGDAVAIAPRENFARNPVREGTNIEERPASGRHMAACCQAAISSRSLKNASDSQNLAGMA